MTHKLYLCKYIYTSNLQYTNNLLRHRSNFGSLAIEKQFVTIQIALNFLRAEYTRRIKSNFHLFQIYRKTSKQVEYIEPEA